MVQKHSCIHAQDLNLQARLCCLHIFEWLEVENLHNFGRFEISVVLLLNILSCHITSRFISIKPAGSHRLEKIGSII